MSAELLEKDVVKKPGIENDNGAKSNMISVIASVFNFEEGIRDLYQSLSETMTHSGKNYELVFVDDASEDNTYNILLEIEKDDPRVKIIKMRTIFGEAASFDAGIKNSGGDTIVFVTGRVRIAAAGLLDLLETLEDGHDMVVGWRYPRADSTLNQIVSKSFNWLVRKISNIQIHDMNSGVLVAKREVLENIEIYGALNHFLPVLAVRKGYKVTECKIKQLKGWFRKSRYFKEYLQRLLDILTVIFLTRYSKKPLHFLGFVGTVFTLVGLGINFYLFFYRLLEIGPIGGRPLLLFGSLLLVVGIQMISIGLIGEMIIFTHARDIKEYNIEKIVE
jgi:glycosyltransferase involved in cell wall biosynthesis